MHPLDRSTIWPYDERGEPGEFYYQRNGHPAGVAAERALGALDGGHALLFPSGAGATTALVLALLEPGATIALAEGAYYGTGRLFERLRTWGLDVVEYDQTGSPPDDVQLVWAEAPSNPFLTLPDLDAAAAHAAPVVVDATAATPIQLRPLEHARELVRRLREHADVRVVRYPGFGGLLSFDVADGEAARRVETSTRVITNATSLGGVRSVMETRRRWEGDRVPAGLLRLSVGLEDVEALWTDLAGALQQV